ncbi:MAG: hypothetical protein V5A55_13250 [Halovenus sp.]
MPSDQWRTGTSLICSWWRDLERDWQSVVAGAVVVVLSAVPEIGVAL